MVAMNMNPPHATLLADTPDNIRRAARFLRAGELVAFPTETVYGLGADATNDDAVARIYEAKGRPTFNPLIIHLPDIQAAAKVVRFDARAEQTAQAFWPGALTMVLPRCPGCSVSLLASAGLETLAVRIPNHSLAHTLLEETRVPVAAPSANRSGTVSPTSAAHVLEDLDHVIAAVLDGGPCTIGLESTVIDLTDDTPTILRQGGIPQEDLEEVLGPIRIAGVDDNAPKSPGMLSRHYAPSIPMRLNAQDIQFGETLLAFGPDAPQNALNLSSNGNLTEAAANLFSMIRLLDDPIFSAIAVSPIPETGLGRAINDRLRRAAEVT